MPFDIPSDLLIDLINGICNYLEEVGFRLWSWYYYWSFATFFFYLFRKIFGSLVATIFSSLYCLNATVNMVIAYDKIKANK